MNYKAPTQAKNTIYIPCVFFSESTSKNPSEKPFHIFTIKIDQRGRQSKLIMEIFECIFLVSLVFQYLELIAFWRKTVLE